MGLSSSLFFENVGETWTPKRIVIFWRELPLQLASDSNSFLRLRAKFFRIPHPPSHSLKVLRKENESFPNSHSLRIQGNDHHWPILVSYACMFGLHQHSGDHQSHSKLSGKQREIVQYYCCMMGSFRNFWGHQAPLRSTDTIYLCLVCWILRWCSDAESYPTSPPHHMIVCLFVCLVE